MRADAPCRVRKRRSTESGGVAKRWYSRVNDRDTKMASSQAWANEQVSRLPDCQKVSWRRGVVELAAELRDVRVHGSRLDQRIIAPNLSQELGTARDVPFAPSKSE